MLDELTLEAAVRTLNDRYAALLDNMELERWAALFTEDAFYQIIARENHAAGLPHATVWCKGAGMIRDRVLAVREALVFEERALRHMVSGVLVTGRDGEAITAQANFMLVESMIDAKPEIIMVGRYIDRFVRAGDGLLIRERSCVFDNHWLPRALVLPI